MEKMSASHEYRFAPLLQTLESTFKCAGVCTMPKYFLFSTIEVPEKLCKDAIIELITKNQSSYSGFSFVGATVGLAGLLLSVSICRFQKIGNPSWEAYKEMKFAS